ncbi:MAG TPA: HigA family addiction module antitoxin [Candidatus Saccharimonadales bacterium]|jgi:addiction module HigA family antidote|nr:HigA family addiction module antitoxin [Candidatus Saccharimonadales bacterium]
MSEPIHPGFYIRAQVIPPMMPVKEAAKLLGVGRPALSNLLNGNAALSPEMAARLEKAFGVDQQKLLKLQGEFEQYQQRASSQKIAVGTYVPSFCKITARDLEQWVDGNLEARSHLPVLLRKLVSSTGQELSLVDFPGYDNAEKKGWDGRVDASAATPWIPIGKSGWEFGCNEDSKQKADSDYAARVKAIPAAERSEMNFVFVTPRNWNGKTKWVKAKQALGAWKSVRAYDASDLEQWLEQSLQAQGWLSEKMGSPSEGMHSLDEQWRAWASVTDPELSKELFAPSVEHFKATVKNWIENPPSSPLIVCGDSKLEALAFLYCMFEDQEPAIKNAKDRFLVFSSAKVLRKLTTASPAFFPIVFTDEVERELGGVYKNQYTIIVRPRNTVEPEPTIVLDLLRYEPFQKALKAMGINDHLKIDDLARESGYSPTILRRRLAKAPAIRTPEWAQDNAAIRRLIPMMLVGACHMQSKGDCEIMSVLAGKSCDEIEKDVTELLKFDDPPVWSAGKFRGVASKIDAFFAVQGAVTQKDLEEFFFAAEIVLSEKDPALELPEDKRAFANLYGKSREHSGALRDGICETLVLLAVHGNGLFSKRSGVDVRAHVDMLIQRLLTPLTPEKLLSQTDNLPLYAEAAPRKFLRIIEDDLKSPEPQVYSLMKPADTGIFGHCPRTGLLWALENLAWSADQLPHVSLILAKLAERKINDNWANKPDNSLQAIFRSWVPQTAAPLEDRKKALEVLALKYPAIGWGVCVAQLAPGHRIGHYSYRPRWRSDASGAGHPVTWDEMNQFARKALDLALAWPSHDEKTLGDLVESLQDLPEEDQETIWNLVDKWAATEPDENCKAALRERIRRFAFLRRSAKQGMTAATKDRARRAYDVLTPTDFVNRNLWLFEQQWVEESFDELEEADLDYQEREERIRGLRIAALQEIWEAQGFKGLKTLLSKSGAASTIGGHMAEGVIAPSEATSFLAECLNDEGQGLVGKFDEAIRGFLLKLDAGARGNITQQLAKVLPAPLLCRLLKCSPFQHDTWEHVDTLGHAIREQYWREVHPNWLMKDSPDLNEVIDRLLESHRPLAGFFAVQAAIEEVETSRLKRLLQEVGTCGSEAPGTHPQHAHYLSKALNALQKRVGVSEDEMARLEFLFVSELEHTSHRIPNLEKQIGSSPALFVQALALIYPRQDGGEDPPEWVVNGDGQRSAVGTAAHRLLENVKRIPGTDDAGKIDEKALRDWIKEAQSLCIKHGRAEIGDRRIGQLLSAPTIGADGIWPSEQVRNVLEECGTAHIATGVQIGVYNARGAHFRGEGGGEERELAEKYRNWSRKLAFEYPYVANLVEGIAETYERQAAREDSEAVVRRRLGH